MMTFAPEVETALREILARIGADVPAIGTILAEAKAEGASEFEVMHRLQTVLMVDPGLATQIEQVASAALAPLRDEALTVVPHDAEIVLPPRRTGGMPRINPLYSAALQEKIQFDGDVPELRTGPLPEGASPAVPVATDARDPVAIGWMLETASTEVAAELRAIEGAQADQVKLLSDGGAPTALEAVERTNLPDPVGYVRGQVPALRQVEAPTGAALATLTPAQRGQLAWKFLSTTQGRRTATGAIRNIVAVALVGDGHDVAPSDGDPRRLSAEEVLAYAEWVVDLDGPGSTQPGFAFVDTAARVLVKKLSGTLDDRFADTVGVPLLLEVIPVNTVDVRKVGWAARLSPRVPA